MRPYDPRSVKPLIVGEVNPYGSDPHFALYPFPAHASGGRLREILGLSLSKYMNGFDRVNLCTGRWSMKLARPRAQEIVMMRGSPLVLLGRKVVGAFFGRDAERVGPFDSVAPGAYKASKHRVYVLPHPSGLCRAWNEPGAAQRARELLREVLP